MKKESNPMVGIAGAIAGISVAIIAVYLSFARDQALYLIPIIASLAIMGIFLGYFASKKK